MENVKVEYSVDQSAAVLAGKSKFGKVVIDIDPATLTDEQRAELVVCSHNTSGAYELNRNVGGTNLEYKEESALWPSIDEPSDDVPARLLNARIAIRKASDCKKAEKDAETASEKAKLKALDEQVGANPEAFTEGQGIDLKLRSDIKDIWTYGNEDVLPNVIALRKSVEDRVKAAREEARAEQETEQRAKWTAFLESYGEPDQLARFNARCLPEDERNELATDVIFGAMLENCSLYSKLDEGDITHDDEDCYGEVKFRGSSAGFYDPEKRMLKPNRYGTDVELNSKQWETLMNVVGYLYDNLLINIGKGVFDDGIQIEIRQHEAYCEGCDAETLRLGVRVSIQWNGSTFEQEYAL